MSEMNKNGRLMYENDTELGKMKLQAVKANLYEATTKVLQYSIEMYSQKELREWMLTDLIELKKKDGDKVPIPEEEIKTGRISLMDITNCNAILGKVRKNAYDLTTAQIKARIEELNAESAQSILELDVLKARKSEIEAVDDLLTDEKGNDFSDIKQVDDEPFDNSISSNDYSVDNQGNEFDDDDNDDDDDDDEDRVNISSGDMIRNKYSDIWDKEDEIEAQINHLEENIEQIKEIIAKLKNYNGNELGLQKKRENDNVNNLRVIRNDEHGHYVGDEIEISEVGSWEPEAGALYMWASAIKAYIEVIERRFIIYALFDDFYAERECKNKFDSCKIYVQKQINELYVKQSSVTFEFAGELYDRDDEIYNFKNLIKSMAENWDTGIRYLAVVTNEDMPEMNMFFKECLSGTNKYVDYYLIDRNELRVEYRKKEQPELPYVYFKFLYDLNPELERIYWSQSKSYSEKEFAKKVLYEILKCRFPAQLKKKIVDSNKGIDNLDFVKWCEKALLSAVFYNAHENIHGMKLARDVELATVSFSKADGSQIYGRYRKVIKTVSKLYFYMLGETVFWFPRKNQSSMRWYTLKDAREYLENENNFKSYTDLYTFVDDTRKSDYFKQWLREVKSANKEGIRC